MAKVIALTRKKLTPKHKYALNEQVDMLPKSMKTSEVVDHLKKYGITQDEFYRDRKIPYGSDSSIPSDRLFIYAKVFDCPVADLLNHEIKANSIRQKNLKLKTGLA